MGEKPVGLKLAHYTSCLKVMAELAFWPLYVIWFKLFLGTEQVTILLLIVKQVVAAGGEVPSQKHLASLWRAACTLHTRAPNRIFPWFVYVRPVLPFCSPLLWPRPELIHDGRACNRSAHPRPDSSDQLQPSLPQKSRAACPASQRRKRRWVGQACGARPFSLRLLLIGETSQRSLEAPL